MARITRTPATAAAEVRHVQARLSVDTSGEGFTEITNEASAFLAEIGASMGVLTLLCRHTSASLTIQENADPDVRTDLITALRSLAPRDFGWVHDTEGPDDMPAHVRTLLSDTSLSIPVSGGRMTLGTWQGIYLIEHRARPHRREVVLAFTGATGHIT
ncbi:secondary thiamine-phosphate synthase enzyme YjbQ [Xanthobacter autotrophicus DSM 431]|uniref:secondary thiamine-phosphate synthase enzyme YjbQ n=1 Tax=Xanthobacter nonsaccharivorans TaxID=3119912 RepID=UPI003728712A